MLKYGALCAISLLAGTSFAQTPGKPGSQSVTEMGGEKDYYFASSNSKNRYFFNRASTHDRTDIGPKVKGVQSLWVPLTGLEAHPRISYMEMEMLVDCAQFGKVGLLKVSGYDKNGSLVNTEQVAVNKFEWQSAPEQTSFNVNWTAACTNIVWPAPAHFADLSSAEVAEKAHQNNVLWNSPAK